MLKKKVKKESDSEHLGICQNCHEQYFFPIEEEKIFLCNQCLKELYRKDEMLNRNELDDNSEEQPRRLEKWGTILVEMSDIAIGVKQLLSDKAAELDGDIRLCDKDELEEKFGINKITETAVSNCIERHPEYKKFIELQRKANKRRDIIKEAVGAMRERGSMIKVLKDLYCTQYFDRTGHITGGREQEVIGATIELPLRKKGGIDAKKKSSKS